MKRIPKSTLPHKPDDKFTKDKSVNICYRIPQSRLNHLKQLADQHGIKTSRLITKIVIAFLDADKQGTTITSLLKKPSTNNPDALSLKKALSLKHTDD